MYCFTLAKQYPAGCYCLCTTLIMEQPKYATFETEHRVRPDDIDMFQHVHNSKYFDYVLAARYEQMDTCYGMAMEKFMERGFGWVVRTAHVDYKRPLMMGDYFLVRTGIETIDDKGCRVAFTITNKATKKICCDGWFDYTMIDMKTGRGAKIPDDIIEHYRIYA
jgi:YbgC/YbaW family acyl-CoA thioester hydrolase